MKRFGILALALVLGCTLFTGCRRQNDNMVTVPTATQATTPTIMPTLPPMTQPPTEPATTATESTGETGTEAGTDAATDPTGETGARSRVHRPAAR